MQSKIEKLISEYENKAAITISPNNRNKQRAKKVKK